MNPWEVSSEQRFEQRKNQKIVWNPWEKIQDLRWFSGCMRFLVTDSCLEWLDGTFEPWFVNFWVDLSELGLGFHSLAVVRRETREERKEKKEKCCGKMNENRVRTFYIRRWTGWVLTRSSAPRFGPLDLDPNGSGSIQRLRGVLEIRIHQPRGFGPGSFGPFCFLFSFRIFLLCFPLLLLFRPPVCFNFFPKISKNYYVFLICFWLFCDIFTCLRLMKIICVNFSFDSYSLCVFVWIFLYDFWSEICHVMLMFGT